MFRLPPWPPPSPGFARKTSRADMVCRFDLTYVSMPDKKQRKRGGYGGNQGEIDIGGPGLVAGA